MREAIIDWTHSKCSMPDFTTFSDQVIYPGKVTEAPCFRIGNIGDLTVKDMQHLLNCIKTVLAQMEIPLPLQ